MNKKIFAALASATMALSATGSLAVFAEDFDVVTEDSGNNGAGSGLVVPNTSVVLNSENFPDEGFLKELLTQLGKDYGEKLDSTEVKNTTTIKVGSTAKNLEGISVFGNLDTIITDGAATNLESADLSKNTKLKYVTLTGATSLTSIALPEGKTLETVTVSGDSDYKAPLTAIDFSKNKFLRKVTVTNTNVAKIDLSDNVYLEEAILSNNDLNTIDVTDCASLNKLNVAHNELYGITLPVNKVLTDLNVSNNLLQELDITPVPALKKLRAANNELRDINLEDNTQLDLIRLEWNHIGALTVPAPVYNNCTFAEAAGSSWVNPQVVYVDDAFNAINLTESFENLDTDKVANLDGSEINDSDKFNTKTGVLNLNNMNSYLYKGFEGGKSYSGAAVYVVKASVLNRLYNPNSGEHFYTKDIDEKDALVKLGWQDEGIGWVAPTVSSKPVYRLYNPNAGDHHYTTNTFERDTLTNIGWKYEGIGWYSYVVKDTNAPKVNGASIKPVNVLREYNPNAKAAGSHNYTTNPAENDFLVSVGWLDEGIAWQSLK